MINKSKVELLISRIIEDYENGYCPLHFEGPGCDELAYEDATPQHCRECIFKWVSSI